jgi:hypothetical protein
VLYRRLAEQRLLSAWIIDKMVEELLTEVSLGEFCFRVNLRILSDC